MNEYITTLIQKYKRLGILVDTNILLVYFVGLYSPELIPKFKRTEKFTMDDYGTIVTLLEFFDNRVTTPHILTEVSNFIGQLPSNTKFDCYGVFSKALAVLTEQYLPAQEIAASGVVFSQFGLTDAGIALLVKDKYLVLTDDLRASHNLANSGIDVLNFNHIRELNW